jgi:hypothetical protein
LRVYSAIATNRSPDIVCRYMKALDILTILFIISSILLWCIGVVSTFVYKRRLRRWYPEIASRLAPGLLRKSIAIDFAGIRFLFKREYRSLDRPDFVGFCDFYRVVSLAFLFVFPALIVCLMYGGLRH